MQMVVNKMAEKMGAMPKRTTLSMSGIQQTEYVGPANGMLAKAMLHPIKRGAP
jgi:hypothetical protein